MYNFYFIDSKINCAKNRKHVPNTFAFLLLYVFYFCMNLYLSNMK